ncbi:MAG TPA: STAS domain-containing protein [Syntrophorhabdaceae bacterium]|nr:STAS domain-containing protein [Syntrophorhabdaceae bacterium]
MMDYTVQDGAEATNITFRGDLTIQSAGQVRRVLREALDSCQTIKISLKDIESIDLSCIQIFCAARKTAFKADKRLTLDAALPEAAALAIEQAGFDCLKDCGNNENACPVMRRTDG